MYRPSSPTSSQRTGATSESTQKAATQEAGPSTSNHTTATAGTSNRALDVGQTPQTPLTRRTPQPSAELPGLPDTDDASHQLAQRAVAVAQPRPYFNVSPMTMLLYTIGIYLAYRMSTYSIPILYRSFSDSSPELHAEVQAEARIIQTLAVSVPFIAFMMRFMLQQGAHRRN